MKGIGRTVVLTCLVMTVAVGIASGASPSLNASGTGRMPSGRSLRGLITRISLEHGVDPRLVHALIRVESGYNPRAVSRKGAVGLMQIMPATARRLHVRNSFDPAENVRAGVRELARLIKQYGGNLPRALAAYNAGESAVNRYGGVPPYRETRGYVERIMSIYTGRPYEVAGNRGRPVRLDREGGSGEIVITNLPGGSSRPPLQLSAGSFSSARGGEKHLTGGFGR